MGTRVRSFAKVNLGLAIGPVRADGFHGLTTLYQTLALHDVVTVSAEPTSRKRDVGDPVVSLTANHPGVPVDARNTAWRMVEKALARMGVGAEVAVHVEIEKRLPVQGGLGAGSANAAAALIGLERELGWALPEAQRLEMAAEVGSDVPLFLIGGAVLGVGRGEVVSAMEDLPATACVVAVPEVGVSTPRAFADWDERQLQGAGCGLRVDGGLTSGAGRDRLEELSHVYASVLRASGRSGGLATEAASGASGIVRGLGFRPDPEKKQDGSEGFSDGEPDLGQGSTLNGLAGDSLLALVRTGIENDFEEVVFPQYPLLREIKHELMGVSDDPRGAVYAALSGSGSALFGLYRSAADAEAAQRRVQALGCKALLTETLPRQEYWRTMFAE